MTGDLSISQVIGKLHDNFSQYIVQPLNAFGFGGFVFDIAGEETTHLASEITDHYVEDNTAIQDHIAIKPVRFILKNYVGELVHRTDKSTNTFLQNVTQKMTVLNSYLPNIAAQADQIQQILKAPKSATFEQISNSALDLWTLTKNLNPASTKQAQAYAYFKAMQQQKILTSIQTPYEFLNNMAIESVVGRQSEDTVSMSDFTVTLKQIRTAARSKRFDYTHHPGRIVLYRCGWVCGICHCALMGSRTSYKKK